MWNSVAGENTKARVDLPLRRKAIRITNEVPYGIDLEEPADGGAATVPDQADFNPASIAMIIPAMGVGLMLPWSGAVAATAFATGQIEMRNMIRIGAVATVVFAFLVTGIHILLAPIL